MGSEEQDRVNASSKGETWGWGVLRPPPVPAVLLGVVNGVIAGNALVYAIVIALRLAKVAVPKVKERIPIIGSKND